MIDFTVNKQDFSFKYLPDYAAYLVKNKLEEFVKVGIRFARQYDLPMMKPLSRIPEEQLIQLSMDSNKEILTALSENNIAPFIEKNTRAWIENKIGYLDRSEIAAEDLTLAYYIRRKTFSHFLYSYSPNPAIHQLIYEEVDTYSTMEELITLRVYLQMIKDPLIQ